ncbi:MAG TPA: glycosyltransferase family 9 protein [Terriglobales bacterium]|nr:glycosyltransferase family 9 protein [Terriglobales bacterium]
MRTLMFFPGALGDFLCLLPGLVAFAEAAPSTSQLTLVAKPELLSLLDLNDVAALGRARRPGSPASVDSQQPLDVAALGRARRPGSPAAVNHLRRGYVGPARRQLHARLVSIDRAEIAALFSGTLPVPSHTATLLGGFEVAHSWTGYGDAEFAAALNSLGPRAFIHRFRPEAEHAVDYYARCLQTSPAATEAVREVIACDDASLAAIEPHCDLRGGPLIAIHPGSGSPGKNWLGFAELMPLLRQQLPGCVIAALLGPAELEGGVSLETDVTIATPQLSEVAAILRRAAFYIGNDAGISHLAGALGTPGLALFADTDPAIWAPRGPIEVVQARRRCSTCRPRTFCTHRLTPSEVAAAFVRSLAPRAFFARGGGEWATRRR